MRKAAFLITALFIGLAPGLAKGAQHHKRRDVELKSSILEWPSLIVSIGPDVRTSVYGGGGDFVTFDLEKLKGGKVIAEMIVYVGSVPRSLSQYALRHSPSGLPQLEGNMHRDPLVRFDQEPGSFTCELADWSTWKRTNNGRRVSVNLTYLYNTLMSDRYPPIVSVQVSGSDNQAVKELKKVASKMRFQDPPPDKKTSSMPPSDPAKPANDVQEGKVQPVEIKSPRPEIPSLIVSVTSDVQTSVVDQPRCLVFKLEKMGNDKPEATMTIEVGNSPTKLGPLTQWREFGQDLALFANEKAAWFTWIDKTGAEETLRNTAYLYNTLNSGLHRFVVHVTVSGSDFRAVSDFKNVAEKMRFRGVEPRKEIKALRRLADARDEEVRQQAEEAKRKLERESGVPPVEGH